MKFFIDTANVDEIRKANDMGVIAGVTTNPSLIAKEHKDYAKTLAEIATIVDGPISGEVKATTTDAETMIKEGEATVNGSIYQTYYQVDAQTRTGVKKISVSGVLYEKGTIGTWQKVSSCSNSSTTSTCMVSSSFNTKPGKSYRLEYSATFSYSDGRSETITGSTSR